MTSHRLRIVPVRHPRAKRPDMARVWDGAELVSATCRECARLTPVASLVVNGPSIGGRVLLCRRCHALDQLERGRNLRRVAARAKSTPKAVPQLPGSTASAR